MEESTLRGNAFAKNVRRYGWIAYLLLISVVIALFAFQSSPLYPINTWVDPNCFLTVGRVMADGKVLYRDIYEQKGPYVFFLHAFVAMFSDTSFLGIWFFEIINLFFCMLLIAKIVGLYGYRRFVCLFIATLVGLSACFSYAMVSGDGVEEFASVGYIWLLYITVKNIKQKKDFTWLQYLGIGITAGIIFWSKFTVVGIYVGWFAYFAWKNIRLKKYKEIGKALLWITGGIALVTLPCLIYFMYHHAVGDWWTTYIYNNLFLYNEGDGIFIKIGRMIKAILLTLVANPQYNLLALFGVVWFALKKKGDERWFLTWIFPIMTIVLYIGGRGYRYYGLPLYTFSVFGWISLLEVFQEKSVLFLKRLSTVAMAIMVSISLVFFFVNGNQHYIFRDKEDTAQYQVAQYIKEHGDDDPTLLTWGMLDSGFYLATEQIPPFKHFNKLNIPLQEMYDEVQRYMDEGLADFIIYCVDKYGNAMKEHPRYEKVATFEGWALNNKHTYILYQLKA